MPIDSNDGFGGRVDSIDKLKYLLPSLRAELKDERMMFSMYSFLYHLWRRIFAEKMWNFICWKQFGEMDLRNWAFFAQTEISFVWEIGNMQTPLSQIFFGIADKFRDIYNFAFGWAKEKVHPFYSPFRTSKVLSKGWISVLFHSQPC
jgi:hypothetical protein